VREDGQEKRKTMATTHHGTTTPAIDVIESRQSEEDVCGKKTVRTRRKGEEKRKEGRKRTEGVLNCTGDELGATSIQPSALEHIHDVVHHLLRK
jgi:hypothetical protein